MDNGDDAEGYVSVCLLHPLCVYLFITYRLKQSHLDGIVTRTSRPPVFTTAGLLDHIVELVVREDEVINFALLSPPFV